jgi:hypothetical protein
MNSCPTARVALLRGLSYCKGCPTARVVLLQGLSYCECCPTASAVLPGVLSYQECCPTGSTVLPGVLSNRECFPTTSVFLPQNFLLLMLFFCECCPIAYVVLLQDSQCMGIGPVSLNSKQTVFELCKQCVTEKFSRLLISQKK